MRFRDSANQLLQPLAAFLTLPVALALCLTASAQSAQEPLRAAQVGGPSASAAVAKQAGDLAPPEDGEDSEDTALRKDIERQVSETGTGEEREEAKHEEERLRFTTPSWSRLLPPRPRQQLHRRLAWALERMAVYPLAERAYAQWVALEPERVAAWYGLARSRVRGDDYDGGESALNEAIARADADVGPDLHWRLQRDLGELHMLQERFADAVTVLDGVVEMRPDDHRVVGLLSRSRHHIDSENYPDAALGFHPWPAPPSSLGPRAIFAGSFLLLFYLCHQLLALFRGSGELVVSIDYPGELKGEFSVRLSRQRGQRKHKRGDPALPGSRTSSRTEHRSVTRGTHFRRVRAGSYYVSVEGVLRDPETNAVLTSPYEELSALIFRGSTVQLEFDLSPRECPVDVRVLWDKRPAKDASVASRGLPQSLRYTRDGDVRLRLPKGEHTIAVGSGDRVAERAIVVDSFQPIQLTIDLAGSEDMIFKGCPPAVTPYLHGDLGAAARALELDGHTQLSHLLQARVHHERGQTAQAAKHFELAGRLVEAAELHTRIKKFASAAELFERAEEPLRAAEMHFAAGDPLKAGAAYQQGEDYDRAAECFAAAGEHERQVGAMEHAGRYFDAADLALAHHDRARAIKLLQQVVSDDVNFPMACRLLAEAFEHEGHVELAAERLERLIEAGIQDDLPQLHSKLAELLEESDQLEKALGVLTALRELAPTYPNVASRIETLRKRQSQELARQSGAGSGPVAPSEFQQQGDRYELLEEIGRGGMGVVFKAHDTRLRRVVALKRLPENLKDHPKAIALFMREAQSAARLNHTNIVTVYDTDQDSAGTFFITMELLTGSPLNAILAKRGRLKPRDVARLGIQVANGLGYAHEEGIVHRDIKTANLFFTSDRVVKIMDFGLAKMVEEVRRGTTVMGGTPYYMAPEQGVGGAADHRADIYAFGVTLYELVTGRVPFPDGDVTFHHRHTTPPDPRSKAPDLPDVIVELIAAMMEKKPEDRVNSAAEVRERLEQLLQS